MTRNSQRPFAGIRHKFRPINSDPILSLVSSLITTHHLSKESTTAIRDIWKGKRKLSLWLDHTITTESPPSTFKKRDHRGALKMSTEKPLRICVTLEREKNWLHLRTLNRSNMTLLNRYKWKAFLLFLSSVAVSSDSWECTLPLTISLGWSRLPIFLSVSPRAWIMS